VRRAESAALAARGATTVPTAPAINFRRLNPDVDGESVVSVMTASAVKKERRTPAPRRFNKNIQFLVPLNWCITLTAMGRHRVRDGCAASQQL
jgi:hypothetical protein